METINDLLKALGNKVPASIAKRLDGLTKLNQKLEVAKAENKEKNTEESQEQLDEIIEFINDTQDDLKDDLRELVAKNREQEELRRREIAKNREEANRQEELKRREIAKNRAEANQKEQLEKDLLDKTQTPKGESEKKSGMGWGGIVVGSALLILSAGAINYFNKKR
jgi:hypothetical protein